MNIDVPGITCYISFVKMMPVCKGQVGLVEIDLFKC